MNRVFGRGGKNTGPTLDETGATLDTRYQSLEKAYNAKMNEVRAFQKQLSTMREGGPKNATKRRAMDCLKQAKVLEGQMGQLSGQKFNVEQASFGLQNVKDAKSTVAAMKTTVKAFKQETKHLNLNQVEDVYDDMADMMDMNDEMGEIMGRSTVPNNFDEEDLDAELEALGNDASFDGIFAGASGAPSVPSSTIGANSVLPTPNNASNPESILLDEFGLPQV